LGTKVSHGCIRFGLAEAKLLYDWTKEGTPVWVL
jgi:lipoprotein-anchoring transpeptidase ErfK/SrfK